MSDNPLQRAGYVPTSEDKEKLIGAATRLVEAGQLEQALKQYLKVAAEERDRTLWTKIGDL
jgi:hypothetical protein